MPVDILKTVSILDHSQYLRASREMIAATEAVGHSQSSIDKISGGMGIVGGVLVGLGAKALKTASDFQQLQRSMDTLYGKTTGDKLFGDLKQYTLLTPYILTDWAKYANLLGGAKENAKALIPVLKDLGDSVTAAKGVDPASMMRATYAIAEIHQGITSLRQIRMLQLAGVPAAEYVKKYLGLNEQQFSNFGKMHLPGAVVEAAVMKGIENDPQRHGAQSKFMDTMAGKVSNIKDLWQQLMAEAGSPFLKPAEDALDHIAGTLTDIQKGGGANLGKALFYGGPALLIGAAGLKALKFWQDMKNAKNLAAIAAKTEMGAEADKMPILSKETDLVEGATTKWKGFGGTLLGVAGKVSVLARGLIILAAARDTISAFTDTKNEAFEGGYDNFRNQGWNAVQSKLMHPVRMMASDIAFGLTGASGFNRYVNTGVDIVQGSKWKEGIDALNRLKPTLAKIENNWNNPKIASEQQVRSAAERLHTIVENTRKHAGEGAAQSAIDAASKAQMSSYDKILADYNRDKAKYMVGGENPAKDQLAYQLDRAETLMQIAKMQAEHGTKHFLKSAHGKHAFAGIDPATQAAKDFNKYRMEAIGLIDKNIAALMKEADAYKRVGKSAAWLKDEKKVLELMQKKQSLKDEKIGKNKDGFDPTIASIISSAGLGEDEIIKRAGISRRFFRSFGHGGASLPPDRFKQDLQKLSKREIHVHVNVAGKDLRPLVTMIKDELINDITHLLSTSARGPIMGGAN